MYETVIHAYVCMCVAGIELAHTVILFPIRPEIENSVQSTLQLQVGTVQIVIYCTTSLWDFEILYKRKVSIA